MIAILALLLLALVVAASPDRWWCPVLGHRPPPGCERDRCIAFLCARCNRVVPGELALRRRR